ncbi:MAG: SulP family inorganic anion transporter [Alphaproteobacteria bacterium]
MSDSSAVHAQHVSRSDILAHFDRDVPAGLVVFLVATPLCLGIAQASGAPLLSGLIAGIVGGLVVSALSRSALSVSGPAAGLAVIVASGVQHLGFRGLLLATLLAGLIQVAVGFARFGDVAHFFPNAVIRGMLAAIGILIAVKQVPHALGYDHSALLDDAFDDGLVGGLQTALSAFTPAAIAISAVCIGVYFAWPRLQRGFLRFVPVQLVAVLVGALAATLLPWAWPAARLGPEHMVALPVFRDLADVRSALVTPDFSRLLDPAVWTAALTLGVVATIESLLSIEAFDRLDPHRRISPPNRELIAQGTGNVVSALVGGLPITSVIVRSSANVQAGGETRMSSMVHGALLLLGVLLLPSLLNHVPLAALAVVLIVVGLKLTPVSLWTSMWKAGPAQFVPFAVTVAAILGSDLLKGTIVGLAIGLLFVVRRQQQNAVTVTSSGDTTLVRFSKDMTFLQKARVKDVLRSIPSEGTVIIDRSRVDFVDDDIEELLLDFEATAGERGIHLEEELSDKDRARRAAMASGSGH